MSKKINILFVCGSNSCRSQMAEGWANHLYRDKINAFSAGIEPRPIDPLAIEVMKEVGVDISKQETHAVQDFLNEDLDLVVTVCSEATAERCPVFPKGIDRLSNPFDNPSELTLSKTTEDEKLIIYRCIRDEIRKFVEAISKNYS